MNTVVRTSDLHPNINQAVQYGRLGLSLASITSSIAFLAAKNGTRAGFSIARGLATSAVTMTTGYAEQAFLGTTLGTDKILNFAVATSFDLAQAITLLPLHITQVATDTSIALVSTSLESVSFLLGLSNNNLPHYNFNFSYTYPLDNQLQIGNPPELSGPFSTTAQSFTHAIPSLVNILKHEWQNPQDAEHLPAESYSALSIARAVVAWASIQNVTRLYHERKWFKALHEIHDWEWRGNSPEPPRSRSQSTGADSLREKKLGQKGDRKSSSIHVLSDVHLPHHAGEILTAEIGEPDSTFNLHSRVASKYSARPEPTFSRLSYPNLRQALRRYSRLVLGGYGGAGMVFFGIQLPSSRERGKNGGNISGIFDGAGNTFGLDFVAPNPPSKPAGCAQPAKKPLNSNPSPMLHFNINFAPKGEQTDSCADIGPQPQAPSEHDETRTLTDVVQEAEEQSEEDDEPWSLLEPPDPSQPDLEPVFPNSVRPPYSWWNLLLGKHDQEIFEAFAAHGTATPHAPSSPLPPSPQEVGSDTHPPPLVHAGNAERLPRFWVLTDHRRQQVVLVLRGTMTLNEVAIDLACAAVPFTPAGGHDSKAEPSDGGIPHAEFRVHEGMFELAKVMGSPGKPVQSVVASALAGNEGYELVLCGHSLGAGVCAILAMMWADPRTCLTVESSGLPAGRHLTVFGFAPPCVMSSSLSKVASPMVHSFAYSHDVITRLSLGSVRDLKRATSWLCYGQNNDQRGETCSNIISRALILEKGFGFMGIQGERESEEAWFLSLRKTLEANMTRADLFPPGRIIWALRDADLHPHHRRTPPTGSPNLPRLFEVRKVEEVFGQVIFSRDMISSHFVQNYDRVLQQFL